MYIEELSAHELLIENNETNFLAFAVLFVLGIAGYFGYGLFFSNDFSELGLAFNLGVPILIVVVVGLVLSKMFLKPVKFIIVINRQRKTVFIESIYILGIKKPHHGTTTKLNMELKTDKGAYDDEYYTLEFTLNDHSVSCSVDSHEDGQQTIDRIHRFIANQAK